MQLAFEKAYRKVVSSSLSRLVAHFWIFRLFMKGKITFLCTGLKWGVPPGGCYRGQLFFVGAFYA